MQRLKHVLWLELYALILASMRFLGGVHTDEAKYLLNIPYPHPPLARFMLHLTDGWPGQEFFWRLVFATLLVQAVWLLLTLSADLRSKARTALAVSWLACSALLLQAGSIMMAPLTALQALLFVFLLLRTDDERNDAGVIGLLWLTSLFTAYQIVLFFPIVWVLLRRTTSTRRVQIACFVLPILTVGVYTLSNPLALASVLIHGDSVPVSLATKVWELAFVWFLGGSFVLSIAGVYGILRNRMWPLFLSFLLVAAYVFLARFSYYAILFLPLSIGGFVMLLRRRQVSPNIVASGVVACSLILLVLMFPLPAPSPARRVMHTIQAQNLSGTLLINGAFGHEWQYESTQPILRYKFTLLPLSSAVICVTPCSELDRLTGWRQIMPEPPLVYVHP